MNTYTFDVKTETADLIRAAAPRFGLVAHTPDGLYAMLSRSTGIEPVTLNADDFARFDVWRKEKKLGIDAAIRRLLK